MDDDPDDALMLRAGGGDHAAFRRLVERHLGRASRIAARIVADRSDAEEIVQEAFLRTWRKAPTWRRNESEADGTARFSTWFHRVLVNLCLDRRRHIKPVGLEAAEAVPDPAADGFAVAARRQRAERVAKAVATLPANQRAAITLCYFEGLSNIEAASALEVSVGALESLLVRARRRLRDALADLAGTAEEGMKSHGA